MLKSKAAQRLKFDRCAMRVLATRSEIAFHRPSNPGKRSIRPSKTEV